MILKMVLIGAGHTSDVPGITHNNQNEFEICRRLAVQIQAILSKNQIGAAVVPFDYPIKDRAKWIKSNSYNKKDNIYLELHLSSNQCAHVVASKNSDKTLKDLFLKYFDTEAEIDVEDLPEIKDKSFDIINKLSTNTYIIEAGNIVDYSIDSDFALTSEAIAHAVADYLKVPFNLTPISNDNETMNPLPPMPKPMIDPNQRREQIKELYRLVFRTEGDANGIAYYMVHTEIPTEQILRDMIESTDHAKILDEAKEAEHLKHEVEELRHKVEILEKEVQEKDAMVKNYEAIGREKVHSQAHPAYQQIYPEPAQMNQPVYGQPYTQNVHLPEEKKKGIGGFIKSIMGK